MMNIRSLVPLAEILKPVSRPEWVDPEKTYRVLGAHWYAEGLYVKDTLPGSQIRADKVFRVEKGDFVYNRLFAWKGSFAVATEANAGCYVSNEFPCFAINQDRADARFLWRYFSRLSAWEEALSLSTGGTPTSRNRLKEEKFLAMEIPVPPLPEQRRIVARIEELAAKINEAHGLRWKAVGETEALVTSKGTKLFEALIDGPRQPIDGLGENGSNPIQIGPFGVQLHTSDFVETGVPVLNVGNVWPEGLQLEYLDRVSEEKAKQLSRYSIRSDDLLFARSGATLGKVCLVPPQCDGWLMTGHLFRIRFDPKRVLSPFAFAAFRRSRQIQEQVFDQVRGATRPGYNTTLLGMVELPVPPLCVQGRIVEQLDALQAQVDSLRKLQSETAAELDALLPSILDKAFKGEL